MTSDEKGEKHLRQRVRGAYSAASREPTGNHAFPMGRTFAESLGYPAKYLNRLPRCATEAFSGVSNVSIFAKLPVRGQILDLGCGAGLDSLIAAERLGTAGSVLGLDFSADMLDRARQAADQAGIVNVAFCLVRLNRRSKGRRDLP
jgi:arsenite methyltransferase